jgi:TPP-dependent pyruvate/acetoin dehydrogenase alpha subunit
MKETQLIAIPRQILLELYRKMLLIRRFEEKIVEVYPIQDMKTPVHLSIGQEAIAAGVCANLRQDDYMFTTHRSHGHCLAKGVDPKVLYAEFYGRITGCCKGKGGSMHPVAPEYGILGTSAIVGGGIPLAVGTALASKMKPDDNVSVVFFGDGAVDEGTFHEGLNFASLKSLPVVFICENNFYATNSRQSVRHSQLNIAKKAEGYGMPGIQIDGNDILDVYTTARRAVNRARSGAGPTLIECQTYRWKGHVGPEPDYQKGFRPKHELDEWTRKCPIKAYEKFLITNQLWTASLNQTMIHEIDTELETALKFAKESPFPEKEELLKDLYKIED